MPQPLALTPKSSGCPRTSPISKHMKPDAAPFFCRAVCTIQMWNGAPPFPQYFLIKMSLYCFLPAGILEKWRGASLQVELQSTSWSWDLGRWCFEPKSSNLFDFLFLKNHWALGRYPEFTHTSHFILGRALRSRTTIYILQRRKLKLQEVAWSMTDPKKYSQVQTQIFTKNSAPSSVPWLLLDLSSRF